MWIKLVELQDDAFEEGPWRTMTVAERCAKLSRMAEIILERKEEIARLDAMDVGKPYHSAVQHEVPTCGKKYKILC